MKIVIGDPTDGIAPKGERPGRANLRTRRVRGEAGEIVTLLTVDVASPTLTNDMLTVFRRNVARARRHNRELRAKIGVAAE